MLPDMDEFEDMVAQAYDEVPQEFRDLLENVEICVEERPSLEILRQMGLEGRGTLLGLYQGVPRTARSAFADPLYPDRIVIYRRPILRMCRNRRQVVEQVRITLVHEIAHHFGISDERLRKLGY